MTPMSKLFFPPAEVGASSFVLASVAEVCHGFKSFYSPDDSAWGI
jgi:hypothetical protein